MGSHIADQFKAVLDIQFSHNIRAMDRDRLWADHQNMGNFFIAFPKRNQAQYLLLAFSETSYIPAQRLNCRAKTVKAPAG